MENCIFCSIISKIANAEIVYEDDIVMAFWDRRPAAPVHILIIPKKHIESMNAIQKEDGQLIGHLFHVARNLAAQNKIADSGYRLVINTGLDARQSVPHLHIHLLGGKGIPPVL